MRRFLFFLLPLGALTLALVGHGPTTGQGPGPGPKQFPDFEALVKGAKQHDGLFKLFLKGDKLFAEIKPGQFDRPFLCPIAIARGAGLGGFTRNYDDQWVLLFRRVGDRVFLIRRNVRFQARKNPTVARAVEVSYHDSVLLAIPIRSIHPIRQGVLISLNDIFMTDFAQLNRGFFDASRSTWHKVKAFPRNIELQVAATYSGGFRRDDSVIDRRGTTIVIHYGLCELPGPGYQPRLADDRVGHFLSVVKDFSNDTGATPFVRYITRWRLERADGSTWKEGGKLVPPKKKIVFWIEKSVPEEYRGYVREGMLEWNKAFAKIGFRDVIEVRQQENEEFDPEDINYNTFRWITNDEGFAMGPSRANPLTGEIIDADIIFDAGMVRYYRQLGGLYTGNVNMNGSDEEDISPIRAARRGTGRFHLAQLPNDNIAGWNDRPAGPGAPGLDRNSLARGRLRALQSGLCECGPCLKRELNLLALTIALRDSDKTGQGTAALTEELVGQAIKETVMHEVGHTLGLRHNFKASTMLKNEDLHNTAITRKNGLVGSVMDYTPINLAPRGVKQGDYFTNTIGPYDYWAIEYAYRPLSGGTDGEVAELKKIASKCATPGLTYATDEDMMTSSDPYVNVWDLGADPMKFGQDRILLAEELLQKLADKGTAKGEGYQRTRQAFGILLEEYGNGAHLISNFIGGVSMHRDHRGDPNERDPLVPVSPKKQREALKFLQEHVLTDKPFQFSPKLLRQLGPDRWLHWGNERMMFTPVEYPIHQRILAIQRVVLDHALNATVLKRIQNNSLHAEKNATEPPLQVAKVFRSLTDGAWGDLSAPPKTKQLPSSIVRRNLQREHLKDLTNLVLGARGARFAPPDARSLARAHLREIDKKIEKALGEKAITIDATTRAHLEECRERIGKVLGASMQVSEP
jgi:hypothetical protein